jgi:hypothetical protein
MPLLAKGFGGIQILGNGKSVQILQIKCRICLSMVPLRLPVAVNMRQLPLNKEDREKTPQSAPGNDPCIPIIVLINDGCPEMQK